MARAATGSRFQNGDAEIPKACLPITRFATCSLSAAPVVLRYHGGAHGPVQLDNWVPGHVNI